MRIRRDDNINSVHFVLNKDPIVSGVQLGMIAEELHKSRIYAIESQLKSFTQQESYLGAKEGGLSVISDRLIALVYLVVRATAQADQAGDAQLELDAITVEICTILGSIDHIAASTTFEDRSVLAEYTIGSIADGLGALPTLVIEDPAQARAIARESVDRVARTRKTITNRLSEIEADRTSLTHELIRLSGSLSSIVDVDIAKKAAAQVREQILSEASIDAIDINRQSAHQVLRLLRGTG